MNQVAAASNTSPAPPARPKPIVQRAGAGFVPVIYHPERAIEWLRFERFLRKTKTDPQEALAYAARVLWYRQRREADKRRRLMAISHPRFGRVA